MMYRENEAPQIAPAAPTWRARATSSLDRHFLLWVTLALLALLVIFLRVGPSGFAPDASVWSVIFGVVSFGALVIASIVGAVFAITCASDILTLLWRHKTWPDDLDVTGSILGWVLLVWLTSAFYARDVAVLDGRPGSSHDVLTVYTADCGRVVVMNTGRACVPSDARLVWCLPWDYTKVVPGRVYTNACRE